MNPGEKNAKNNLDYADIKKKYFVSIEVKVHPSPEKKKEQLFLNRENISSSRLYGPVKLSNDIVIKNKVVQNITSSTCNDNALNVKPFNLSNNNNTDSNFVLEKILEKRNNLQDLLEVKKTNKINGTNTLTDSSLQTIKDKVNIKSLDIKSITFEETDMSHDKKNKYKQEDQDMELKWKKKLDEGIELVKGTSTNIIGNGKLINKKHKSKKEKTEENILSVDYLVCAEGITKVKNKNNKPNQSIVSTDFVMSENELIEKKLKKHKKSHKEKEHRKRVLSCDYSGISEEMVDTQRPKKKKHKNIEKAADISTEDLLSNEQTTVIKKAKKSHKIEENECFLSNDNSLIDENVSKPVKSKKKKRKHEKEAGDPSLESIENKEIEAIHAKDIEREHKRKTKELSFNSTDYSVVGENCSDFEKPKKKKKKKKVDDNMFAFDNDISEIGENKNVSKKIEQESDDLSHFKKMKKTKRDKKCDYESIPLTNHSILSEELKHSKNANNHNDHNKIQNTKDTHDIHNESLEFSHILDSSTPTKKSKKKKHTNEIEIKEELLTPVKIKSRTSDLEESPPNRASKKQNKLDSQFEMLIFKNKVSQIEARSDHLQQEDELWDLVTEDKEYDIKTKKKDNKRQSSIEEVAERFVDKKKRKLFNHSHSDQSNEDGNNENTTLTINKLNKTSPDLVLREGSRKKIKRRSKALQLKKLVLELNYEIVDSPKKQVLSSRRNAVAIDSTIKKMQNRIHEEKVAPFDEFPDKSLDDVLKDVELRDELTEEECMKLKTLKVLLPWAVAPLHCIEKGISGRFSDYQRRCIEALNIEVKNGNFTKEEDEKIMKNWKRFRKMHSLPKDPTPFLKFNPKGKNGLPTEQRMNFVRFLAHGLDNRLLYSVYGRFRRMHKNKRIKTGKYTPKEDEIIINYIKNNTSETPYADLAKILNRCRISVERRCGMLAEQIKGCPTIKWDTDFIEEFMKHLVYVTNVENVQELKDRTISGDEWKTLSERLDINPDKLKRGWYFTVYPRIFIEDTTARSTVKHELIELLLQRDEKDWRAVNWNEIVQHFPGFSANNLNRFLKDTVKYHVPPDIHHNLRECLKYIKENVQKQKIRGKRIKKIEVVDNRMLEQYGEASDL